MEEEKSYKRTFKEVIYDFTDLGETSSLREKALIKVLRIIPDEDYEKLKKDNYQKYQFFIESKDNFGKVHLLEYQTKFILYLNPILEGLGIDRVIAVAAHELAHIVLDHIPGELINEQQEIQAWNRVCEWGFDKEARNHLAQRREEEVIEITIKPPIKPFSFPE